jgi:hypothetical protein
MRRPSIVLTLLLAAALTVLVGADRSVQKQKVDQTEKPTPALLPAAVPEGPEPPQAPTQPQAPAYHMKRFSTHTGGDAAAISTSYRTGVFVGESALGRASSATYRANLGLWFMVLGTTACPIIVAGDLNETGDVTPADIIYIVNYVFKGGPYPAPCAGAADMNCNGEISAADIIYIVNYVFRAGPDPCDVCALIPSVWACP